MKPWQTPEFISDKKNNTPRKELCAKYGISRHQLERWTNLGLKEGLFEPLQGGRPWSHDEEKMLRQFLNDGVNAREIAKRMNRSESGVHNRMTRLGWARRATTRHTPERIEEIRKMAGDGMSSRRIGERLGLTEGAVKAIKNRFGMNPGKDVRSWSDDLIKKAADLRRQGYSCYIIGQMIGKTGGAVESKLRPLRIQVIGTLVRKSADRTYDSVKAANAARTGTVLKMKPRVRAPKEDSLVIPETARPWLTRKFGECVYPYGPRGNIHSCCQPVWGKHPYCESHAALCMVFDKAAA